MRTLGVLVLAALVAGCAQRAYVDAPAPSEGAYRLVLAEGLLFADPPADGPECVGLPAPVLDEEELALDVRGPRPHFGDPAVLILFVTHDVASCPAPLLTHGSADTWGGGWGGVGPGGAFEMRLLRDGGIEVDSTTLGPLESADFVKHGVTLDGRPFEARMTVRDLGEWPLSRLRFVE